MALPEEFQAEQARRHHEARAVDGLEELLETRLRHHGSGQPEDGPQGKADNR
jgi:hypothetical protein